MNNRTIRQHYVPQFYLKNFCNIDEKLHIYDDNKEQNKKFFTVSPKKVLLVKDLYTLKNEKNELTSDLEDRLAKIEAMAANVLNLLINSSKTISSNDKTCFAFFMALQSYRTPQAFEFYNQELELLTNKFSYPSSSQLKKELFSELFLTRQYQDKYSDKELFWINRLKKIYDFALMLAMRKWVIGILSEDILTTDIPLIGINQNNATYLIYPNEDSDFENIIWQFPLSNNKILFMYKSDNPVIGEKIINNKELIENINKNIIQMRSHYVIANNEKLLKDTLEKTHYYKEEFMIKPI